MRAGKQVWIWHFCLYWPALLCLFSNIYLVLLLKNGKKKRLGQHPGKLTSCWVNNAYESEQTSSNVFPLSSASWILFAASVRGAMACRWQIIQLIILTELLHVLNQITTCIHLHTIEFLHTDTYIIWTP